MDTQPQSPTDTFAGFTALMSPDNHWTFMTPEEESWADYVANGDTAPPNKNIPIMKTSAMPNNVFAMSTHRGARKNDEITFAIRKEADYFARDFLALLGIRKPDTSGMRREMRQEACDRYHTKIDAIKVLVISFAEHKAKKTIGFEGAQPQSRQLKRQLHTKMYNSRCEFNQPIVEALIAVGIMPTSVLVALTFKQLLKDTEEVQYRRFQHATCINEMCALDQLNDLSTMDDPILSTLAFVPCGDDETFTTLATGELNAINIAFQQAGKKLELQLQAKADKDVEFEFNIESDDELCECGFHLRSTDHLEKIEQAFCTNYLQIAKLVAN